jgi:hypothetical protein
LTCGVTKDDDINSIPIYSAGMRERERERERKRELLIRKDNPMTNLNMMNLRIFMRVIGMFVWSPCTSLSNPT